MNLWLLATCSNKQHIKIFNIKKIIFDVNITNNNNRVVIQMHNQCQNLHLRVHLQGTYYFSFFLPPSFFVFVFIFVLLLLLFCRCFCLFVSVLEKSRRVSVANRRNRIFGFHHVPCENIQHTTNMSCKMSLLIELIFCHLCRV